MKVTHEWLNLLDAIASSMSVTFLLQANPTILSFSALVPLDSGSTGLNHISIY